MMILRTIKTDWIKTSCGNIKMATLQEIQQETEIVYIINGDSFNPISKIEIATQAFDRMVKAQFC